MSEQHVGGDSSTDWEAAYAGEVPDSPVDTDLMAVARDLPPGSALDLGCGAGQNSIWLARQGWRVHGVDIAGGAVERAEAAAEHAGVEATFERADVTTWCTRERYDLVVSTYAMPPSGPGRTNALTCARDTVAPGGTVIIAEFESSLADSGWMAAEQLVTLAVARRFGQPLPEAMQTLIRDRLGLDSLTYTPLAAGRPRDRVVPTELDARWRGRRCWGEVHDENAAGLGGVAGHAGLFATVHDVARFGVAWLREDPRLRLPRFLRSAVRNQTPDLTEARGLGWRVQPADHLVPFSEAAYGHTGFTGTSLAVDPRRDLVVAICTNRVWWGRDPAGIDRLRLDLQEVFAGATEAGLGS